MTPEEFRRARYAKRKSQQAVVNATGVNKAYISEWETGIRTLTPAAFETLDRYYRDVLQASVCPHCGAGLGG